MRAVDFLDAAPEDSGLGSAADFLDSKPAPAKKQNTGIAGDIVTDLKRGVQQIPGTVSGIPDILVAGITGTPYVSKAADAIGEITGFQPSKWAKEAEAEYSPGRQQAQRNIDAAWEQNKTPFADAAKGDFSGLVNIAKSYVQNPQQVFGSVVQSVPSMLAGGVAGKAAAGAAKIASPVVAAAIGEGAVMAGQQMDQLTEAGAGGRASSAAALATGVLGGAVGALGGKLASKIGVIDPDVALAGGAARAIAKDAAGASTKDAIKSAAKETAKRMAGGMLSEGMLEELPQSAIETVLANLAQGKAWDEGLGRSALEGAMAGGLMGAGFNAVPGKKQANVDGGKEVPPEAGKTDAASPKLLPPPVQTGIAGDQIIANDVERNAAIQAAQDNAESIYSARDAFEQSKQRGFAAPPTLVTDPEPLQKRIDALMGINQERLSDKGRADYEKALSNAFNEQVAVAVDRDGLEVPVTMGEYLQSQVRTADITRDKPKWDAANESARARLDSLSAEEAAPQQDNLLAAPMMPVVGPLSAAANVAVQTGAHQAHVMQTAAAQAQNQALAQASQQSAPSASPQANSGQAAAAAPEAIQSQQQQPAIDVSARNDDQLSYLALHGKPGYKEAATKEIQRRAASMPVSKDSLPASDRVRRKPVEKWSAKELQARLDRGNLTQASETKLRELLAATTPATKQEAVPAVSENAAVGEQADSQPTPTALTVGHIKTNAEPVSIKGGVVHIGDFPAVDFETGEEVKASEGATPQQLADALKQSGALGRRKIFGASPLPQMAKQAGNVSQKPVKNDTTKEPVASGDKLPQVADKIARGKPSNQQDQSVDLNGNSLSDVSETIPSSAEEKSTGWRASPPPVMRRDDIIEAIMRVTGGGGISAKMAQTIIGDKANNATRVRGLFTNRGQLDLDDIAQLLRTEEGYDVQDGNHLSDLIRLQASGNPVYSSERIEREAADYAEKKYREDIRNRAKLFLINTVARKFEDIERDVISAELKQEREEAQMERDAIIAADSVSNLSDDQINELLQIAAKELNGRFIDETWVTDKQILAAFEPLGEVEDEQGTYRFGESFAKEASGNNKGRGEEERFNLTSQTNEQAENQFALANYGERNEISKYQADLERDNSKFSLIQQIKPSPQGIQSDLITANGKPSILSTGNNGEFSPENLDIRYGKQSKGSSNLASSDKAVYGMVSEGKSSVEILNFIASASRNPFNRQLAKLLIKTGINPKVVAGTADGWKFNTGNDKRYAAAYNPKSDTTALFRPASAERNFLHESVHAATIRALEKKGLASAQMNALFKHVKNSGALKGMYGMSNVDEFVAEAFTNPKFQAALKNVKAPVSTSSLGSAWHWFVRVVRGILGLPSSRDDALSKAIDLGIGVMQEDKALRAAGSDSGKVRFSADKPPKKAIESLPKPSESTDGLNEIFAGLDSRGLKKGRAISALESRKDADRIQYIQDNFIDILAKLEDAGQIKINCD